MLLDTPNIWPHCANIGAVAEYGQSCGWIRRFSSPPGGAVTSRWLVCESNAAKS